MTWVPSDSTSPISPLTLRGRSTIGLSLSPHTITPGNSAVYHITTEEGQQRLASEIFPKIRSGNSILFLGAGASATEDQQYLSAQLMEHHRAASGYSFSTDDIVEYVDVLSRNPQFDRSHFDDIVEKCLRHLSPRELHSTIARLPWKEIITTNLDIVIEKAFDTVFGTSDQNRVLRPVRTPDEYRYNPANDEVKLVKLSGCISDRTKYPFIFSTKDFQRVARYYKLVLQSVEYMSPQIQFIAVGYSFSDKFAKFLLDRYDRYNRTSKRELLLVDPYVQEEMLPYLQENNIRVLQYTASEFFQEYDNWEGATQAVHARRPPRFRRRDSTPLILPQRLTLKLGDTVKQIHPDSQYEYLSPQRFYHGERPSFYVIRQNFDVIRSASQKTIVSAILSLFDSEDTVIPIAALTGLYGVGKTTFAYRLASSILASSQSDVAIFEVVNPQEIRAEDLRELLGAVDIENVLLLFDECEVDSFFKAMIELRSNLSIPTDSPNIVMLVPIRDNILDRLTHDRTFPNLHRLQLDGRFNREEATDLIRKLDDHEVISVRDEGERRSLASSIVRDYQGDAFVSLLTIVSQGQHDQILRSAYEQLSEKARESFLLTSLLYRYKIPMPSSLLMKLVSKNWPDFKRDVMEYDARGILVQEERTVPGGAPDLYFRTRHSVISEKLIGIYLGDVDARFAQYQRVFRQITYTAHNSGLVVNLLKAMRDTDEFPQTMINVLFDTCASEFAGDPHFNLHYAINLQYRGDRQSLRQGIERIVYAEGFLNRRNHRLIHRRAVLNYRLARVLDEEQAPRSSIQSHIDEARDLFEIKLIMDPFSVYSYREFLQFQIWHLSTFVRGKDSRLRSMIAIEGLFERAKRQLHEGRETIARIEAEYRREHGEAMADKGNYGDFIQEMYEDRDMRAYALILYYYYYTERRNTARLEATLMELGQYEYLSEVSRLLFHHYGYRLNCEDDRARLLGLAKTHGDYLFRQDPVPYDFFVAVAEAYNRRFEKFEFHMRRIRDRFRSRFHMHQFWTDGNGSPLEFDAVIVKGKRGRLEAHVIDLQQDIPISFGRRDDRRRITVSSRQPVQLRFYAGGMAACIVSPHNPSG